ncbi:cytochrome c oxidase copper chaperone [Colossoma macropomum]|uniref:cytochrome c oxidase copper chaperone n=1 Tax=Colossoma macropomum TaxID=42526 RepID=UPI0018641611|nr:cytochrome c oxidase copper chaperone [Colossoma macropomum]
MFYISACCSVWFPPRCERKDEPDLNFLLLLLCSCKIMSTISAASVEATPAIEGAQEKKPLKPCCACPETKKARDACIIEKGEERCTDLIEAHKECMRALGFKI